MTAGSAAADGSTGGGTLVLGVGSPLVSDDGLGLVALAHLRTGWRMGPEVQLADGGTWGMNLLPMIEEAGRLLILDAINLSIEPGTLAVLERGALPRYLSIKLSPHQIDLREVLALADLRGTLPHDAVAIGLQPARFDSSIGLTDAVRAGLPEMVGAAVERLRSWGHQVVQVEPPLPMGPEVGAGAWSPPRRPDTPPCGG